MKNPIRILKCMFLEGGVEIVTPGTARTLIQLDADVIHYLSENMVNGDDPEVQLEAHLKKVCALLDSLKIAKSMLDWTFLCLAGGIWIWTSAQWLHIGTLTKTMILQFLLGLLSFFIKPCIVWAVKHHLRRSFP